MDLRDGVGPVGVDEDAVHIGDDQERRVLQRYGVLLDLGQGAVDVLGLAFVFPGEAVLAADIGPTLAASGLGGAFFEGEGVAFGVFGDRVLDAEKLAEVDEMGLGGGALLQLDRPPSGDEF